MDDLRDRFGRLDRIDPPDLWTEAVARAAELEAVSMRPTILRLLLLALALLAALVGAIAIGSWLTRPAPDAIDLAFDNGMIVGQHECQLLAIDPASSEARQLVPSPRGCSDGEHPMAYMAWSADGRYLAYLVHRSCGACFEDFPQEVLDEAGPWLYDATTGVAGQLAPCPERYCLELDISPDGSRVAYIAHDGVGPAALIVTEVGAGGAARRVQLNGMPGRPSFSPDGLRIVVAAIAGGAPGLYTVDLAGVVQGSRPEAPEAVLVHRGGAVASPAWSPDGAWIAFASVEDGDGGIWLMRADGTDLRPLAVTDTDEPSAPAWSPDGTRIAYVRTSGGSPNTLGKLQLWTVSSRGSEPTMIYESACCIRDWKAPTWSPDGAYIAFGVTIAGPVDTGVAIIRPDGTDIQFLSADALEPAWQPLPAESPPSE